MIFFGKDLELFFFLVRTEERCCFTRTLKVANLKIVCFENKLALYTKISEIGGLEVTRITKTEVNLSIKQPTVFTRFIRAVTEINTQN